MKEFINFFLWVGVVNFEIFASALSFWLAFSYIFFISDLQLRYCRSIDYYPKNLFIDNVFNDGIFKGEIWERFI